MARVAFDATVRIVRIMRSVKLLAAPNDLLSEVYGRLSATSGNWRCGSYSRKGAGELSAGTLAMRPQESLSGRSVDGSWRICQWNRACPQI